MTLQGLLRFYHLQLFLKAFLKKLFESSRLFLSVEVGARNERRICAVNCNRNAGFEIVHGLLDKIMLLLEIPWSPTKNSVGYYLKAANGMCDWRNFC